MKNESLMGEIFRDLVSANDAAASELRACKLLLEYSGIDFPETEGEDQMPVRDGVVHVIKQEVRRVVRNVEHIRLINNALIDVFGNRPELEVLPKARKSSPSEIETWK